MTTIEHDAATHDLVWGAAAIGKAIGKSERQAYYLLDHGFLPGRKVGKQWVASRKRLLRAIAGEESAA